MDDYGVLLGVVAVFSVVHSLFGVGLLVFGTPTLLALGFPFEVAVANLLPPSFAISALQSFQGRRHVGRLGRAFSRGVFRGSCSGCSSSRGGTGPST